MLQYLQQQQNNLTPQQQNALQQLTHQYRLMQQHQQQLRLQQQQRAQQGVVTGSGQQQTVGGTPRLVGGSSNQQFISQQQSGFQQTAPRVPQSGTVAQTGFSVDSTGNFPAATGHTLPNAGMPYKSANVAGGGFAPQQSSQFNSNLGYTQISSTTNQSDIGKLKKKFIPVLLFSNIIVFLLKRRYRFRFTSFVVTKRYCHNICRKSTKTIWRRWHRY